MSRRTLKDLESAIRGAWSVETCDPVDVDSWSADNPSRGQCGATALTVQDLLGGDLLVAEVRFGDGTQQGFHYWNRLPGGVEVDLTRAQFVDHEVVQEPTVVTRPDRLPGRMADQYLLLRDRVLQALDV